FLTEVANFLQLLAILAVTVGLSWRLCRYPVYRLRRHGRLAMSAGVSCIPFMLPFAVALLALPLLGTAPGTRMALVTSYISLGGAGLFLIATLLLSMVEHDRARRR